MNIQGNNRRSDLRGTIPITPVKFGEEQESFFGIAMNISRSGMFVQTPAPICRGEVHSIRFTLPRLEMSVTCRGKVVWNQTFNFRSVTRVGLKFVDMDQALADRIDEWVRSNEGHAGREN